MEKEIKTPLQRCRERHRVLRRHLFQWQEQAARIGNLIGCSSVDIEEHITLLHAREARLVEALELIAGDYTDNWDNGWGYAENKRDMALEALAEHRGEK